MEHFRSTRLYDEAQVGLNSPICSGYICVPDFIESYFPKQIEDLDQTHSLFQNTYETRMREYRVEEAYADERYPTLLDTLFVKQIPFLYQFDVDEDYTNTVGWIPGLNNNELFFISGRDALLKTGKYYLLETPVDEKVLTVHLDKLQARLNLLKDLDKLDNDWI